ncbi:putative protein lysine methyltransferase SET5 [Termitomyces sp. J132]|nr:hypothetical protein C0989_008145 [Termitomyces sp. Mn162]KAH0579669.1 hypothetical protein H2248_002516 [Termitomyces sp. 'cryptogamus']KNZ75559.1 putative protein lysine methyltransferase SET5 [Termitomyces sp. J132]
MPPSKISPSEDDLRAALVALKTRYPSLGIVKTHSILLASYPDWTVSEKRTRKLLQSEGLILDTPSPQATDFVYPTSRLIPDLDISKWSSKVQVRYYDKRKGKGLVATEDIEEGEAIWKEDPFILAPEWEIYDLQVSSAACGYCSTPLDMSSPLTQPCPASSSSEIHCPIRFCNRLCLSRSAKHHPLLCSSQNPGCIPLLKMIKETQWMALHAFSQCTSRVLLSSQRSVEEEDRDWKTVAGLAELGLEERYKYGFSPSGASEPDRESWKKAHAVFSQAFRSPKTPADQKSLARILKKPINPVIEKTLFDYDGFLRGLGKMSLNLEAHGGLYTLHSHLNHSCTPNVSVRHNDRRTALSRITLIAKRSIVAGEELFVTYVNPEMDVRRRRRELQAWGFGECNCVRCLQEAKHMKPEDEGIDDLAAELKASLGVM